MTSNISVEDVRWFHQFIGKITDEQFREGLIACGANEQETMLFVRALRERVSMLRDAAAGKYKKPAPFGTIMIPHSTDL